MQKTTDMQEELEGKNIISQFDRLKKLFKLFKDLNINYTIGDLMSNKKMIPEDGSKSLKDCNKIIQELDFENTTDLSKQFDLIIKNLESDLTEKGIDIYDALEVDFDDILGENEYDDPQVQQSSHARFLEKEQQGGENMAVNTPQQKTYRDVILAPPKNSIFDTKAEEFKKVKQNFREKMIQELASLGGRSGNQR